MSSRLKSLDAKLGKTRLFSPLLCFFTNYIFPLGIMPCTDWEFTAGWWKGKKYSVCRKKTCWLLCQNIGYDSIHRAAWILDDNHPAARDSMLLSLQLSCLLHLHTCHVY